MFRRIKKKLPELKEYFSIKISHIVFGFTKTIDYILEYDLDNFKRLTGVWVGMVLIFLGWDWLSAIGVGFFGFLVYVRIEDSFFKYALARRDKK